MPGNPTSEDSRTQLAEYVRANREAFTRAALREALVSAGHDPAAVDAALDAEGVPPAAVEPLSGYVAGHPRLTTGGILIGAYAGMWLLFALVTDWNAAAYSTVSTWILGAVLGLVGLMSLVYVSATRRLTSGGRGAIVGALTVPLVLLLVIGGLCVPFTNFR
jgi:hypothetical protein